MSDAQRISALPDELRETISEEVRARAVPLDRQAAKYTVLGEEYGLCSSCAYFKYVRGAFKVRYVACGSFEKLLKADDPVVECTGYIKTGTMSIWDMQQIAYIIDIKEPVGFKTEEGD